MASLQNAQIDQSYQGLIKTADNTSTAPFPPLPLQYGDGTDTPIAIGDGTTVGVGDIVTITSGNRVIDVNSQGIGLIGLGTVDGQAGTVQYLNGTFTYGLGFPGAPATNVDFTNATVTGLPGGAAGLENGTGTDSLQSAAALTTNPANAAGNGSIAIGDGASATRQESVAIGQGAEANGSGSEGSIAIGHGSIASSNRGIAIGINGTTNSSEGIVIGDNVDISLSDRSIGIGNAQNITGGSDKIAIGTAASVTGNRGLAFGQNASATANEAIAMGYNVTAAKAQTLSVNALETQTNSTPTAGGIIMSDAGGTERRLNVTATGDLQIDSTAVGGAEESEGQGISPQWGGAYNIPWDLSTFSVTNASAFSTAGNGIHFVAFYAKPGETLDEFYFRIQTAGGTGETMNVGLYKAYEITHGTAKFAAPEYVATIATGIATDSAGKKSITGLNITLPTDSLGGLYFAAFQNVGATNTTRLTRWSGATSNNRVIAFDIYRYNGWVNYNAGGAASLPTGQIDLRSGTGGSSTDVAVDFAWTYKA